MPRLTKPGLGSEEARPPRQLTKLRAGALATSLLPSANAGVDHASPSHRPLRASRKVLAGATSNYDQARATTDGRGEIRFAGLPTGDLRVLSLDPGWTIETPGVVVADETTIEWTAKKRLGARLSVFEAGTNKPVEKAAATFGFDCTFTGGETMDMSQWVGRGNGEVTFVFDPTGWEGVEGRTIVQAVFRGTAQAEDDEPVDWIAEPIEDPNGVSGVAEVRVPASPSPESRPSPNPNPTPNRTPPSPRPKPSSPAFPSPPAWSSTFATPTAPPSRASCRSSGTPPAFPRPSKAIEPRPTAPAATSSTSSPATSPSRPTTATAHAASNPGAARSPATRTKTPRSSSPCPAAPPPPSPAPTDGAASGG